ncbi:MAG TPA: uroporphyrinogen-III synthase [Methylomirabilota bacterium]|nr:uroporphyrinogen-III synthase [Methylomirabilota bacterium]
MSEHAPLAGKRVVVTRSAAQSQEVCRALREAGAVPIVWPLISFTPPADCKPLDDALRSLGTFDWLFFTSQNAVRAVEERRRGLGMETSLLQRGLQVAAVGPATASAIQKFGLPLAYIAKSAGGVALAEELEGQLRGRRVLLPRSDRANPDLPEALRRLGADVTEVVAYRTLLAANAEDEAQRLIAEGSVDAVVLYSPSAVEHMAEIYGRDGLRPLQESLVFAAIGPVTAGALRAAGVTRVRVACDTTVSGILDCLAEAWQEGAAHR